MVPYVLEPDGTLCSLALVPLQAADDPAPDQLLAQWVVVSRGLGEWLPLVQSGLLPPSQE